MSAQGLVGGASIVGGVVAELIPVSVHALGSSVPCGPAAYAVALSKYQGACRGSALSWVLIGAALIVVGLFVVVSAPHPNKAPQESWMTAVAWVAGLASVVVLVVVAGLITGHI